MNVRAAASTGLKWSAIERVGQQVISFGLFALLARLVEPEAFGLVAAAAVYTALLELFIAQGMSLAIVQRRDLEQGHLDTAFWINVGGAILAVLFTCALATPIAALLRMPRVVPVLCWLALGFVATALSTVQAALLTRALRFRALAARTLASKLIGGAFGIGLALRGYGVWSLVAQQLITGLAATILLWMVGGWRPGLTVSLRHLRDIVGFSAAVLANNLLYFVSQRTDQLVVGAAVGPVALGFYSLAKRVTSLATQMLRQPLDAVSLPLYARLQEDRVLLARTVLHAQELVLAVCCPLTIGLACVAPVVLEVVVGPKWLPAAPILRVLACLEFVAVLTTFAYPVLMATGRPGAVTLLLVAQAAGVPLAALAGVRWGTTGVATGLLAISVMGAGLALVLTQRAMPLSLISFSTVHLRPFVATAGMAASVLLVLAAFAGQTAFARLLLAIFAGAISYVGLSLVVSPRVSADLLSMARMTMRRSVIAEIGAIRTAG